MAIKITIPTSLKDITLRQYKRFLKVQKEIDNDLALNSKMIEIFCNIKLEKVMILKLNDTNQII